MIKWIRCNANDKFADQAIHRVECDEQMCCKLFQKILQYHYLFKTKKYMQP